MTATMIREPLPADPKCERVRSVVERPILFSGAMVRAILDGKKTQTRRAMTPQPQWSDEHQCWLWDRKGERRVPDPRAPNKPPYGFTQSHWMGLSPFGHPGDRLWVRENFRDLPRSAGCEREHPSDGYHGVRYQATWDKSHASGWRPSIHMPRWASRISLEVTGVRVETLQDMVANDAIDEGVPSRGMDSDGPCIASAMMYLHDYEVLWDSLNAKRGLGWDVNPWVWVIEFKRCDA